jgi:tetratricopeptide (TPR) repeat protein
LRIIAQPDGENLIVLDLVSHDQMDRRQFNVSCNGEIFPFREEDVEEISIEEDEDFIRPLVEACKNNTGIDLINIDPSSEELFYCVQYDPESGNDSGIFLSYEQDCFIQKSKGMEPSILLEGGAGSGKTLVAVCQALKQSWETSVEERIYYITSSPSLVDYSKKIANELLGNDPSSPTLPRNITISSFFEVFYELLSDQAKKSFEKSNRVNKIRFLHEWNDHVPGVVLWREMQETLKGSLQAIGRDNNLMSWSEYQRKGGEIEEITSGISKQDIYEAAERYQGKNRKEGKWDDLDLTLEIIKNIDNKNSKHLWKILYCDEVQDFAEVQLYLMLRMTEPRYLHPPKFFLTGDPCQVLNPSGFSWERIKSVLWQLHEDYKKRYKFYDWNLENYDQPYQFSLNFRSQANIVKLSNQINRLRDPQAKFVQAFKASLDKPLVIRATYAEVFQNRSRFGARHAIIAVNIEEQEKLIKQFSYQDIKAKRILDIPSSKGLEFQQVLIFNFFTTFNGWGKKVDIENQEFSDYIYNCLYVCATRADTQLIFVEEKDDKYWRQSEILPYIRMGKIDEFPEELELFFQPPKSNEEWLESAKEYEDQGQYEMAQENYLEGGDRLSAKRMEACIFESMYQWKQAGDIWRTLEEFHKALDSYEKIDQASEVTTAKAEVYELLAIKEQCTSHYEKAAELWQKVGKWQEAAIAWKNSKDYARAAGCLEKLGQYLEASEYYLLVDQLSKAAGCLEKLEQYSEAAKYYLQVNQLPNAARCYRQASHYEEAAKCWERAENWSEAIQDWQSLHAWERIAQLQEKQGNYREAATIWEEHNRITEAINNYSRLQDWQNLGRLQYKQGNYEQALDAYQKVTPRHWEEIYECAQRITPKPQTIIAEASEALQRWSSAAEAYEALGELAKAAQIYEQKLQDFKQAAHIYFEHLNNLSAAQRCWHKCHQVNNIAEEAQKEGHWAKAAAIWDMCQNWEKMGNASEKACNYCQAIEAFSRLQHEIENQPIPPAPIAVNKPQPFDPITVAASIGGLLVIIYFSPGMTWLLILAGAYFLYRRANARYQRKLKIYNQQEKLIKEWFSQNDLQELKHQNVRTKIETVRRKCGCSSCPDL